ncbi:RNA-binding protein 34 [Trichinella sp. T6]|nr:RNA-binding protein 34 [Trichinella sp. T6]
MEGTMTERKDDRDDSNEDERTIFNLKKLFGKIGKIECIRLRSCIPVNPKLPQRLVIIKKAESTHVNAYIRFVKKESVDKALELNGTQMQEHHLFVDRCINRRQYDKKRAVFLGNLAFDIGEEEIYTHFTDCGEIDRIRVVRDPHNYIGKGFGFVVFKAIGLALKLNDSLLKNRKIRVTRWKRPLVRTPLVVDMVVCALLQSEPTGIRICFVAVQRCEANKCLNLSLNRIGFQPKNSTQQLCIRYERSDQSVSIVLFSKDDRNIATKRPAALKLRSA